MVRRWFVPSISMYQYLEVGTVDFLFSMKFCAPVYHIGILLLIGPLALLFGRPKLGLFANFLLCIYWAYVVDRQYILEKGTESAEIFPWAYFGFGIVIVLFGILAFLIHND